jgi:hypothetical protein
LRIEFKHLPPGLAEQYRSLTELLDPPFSDSSLTSLTPAEQADQRHHAAVRLDQLMNEIRQESGLENWGRPLSHPELINLASEGPIIIINVNQRRCDALLITESGISIQSLENLSIQAVKDNASKFSQSIKLASECYRQGKVSLVSLLLGRTRTEGSGSGSDYIFYPRMAMGHDSRTDLATSGIFRVSTPYKLQLLAEALVVSYWAPILPTFAFGRISSRVCEDAW